jgi:diaminopimelate epimerase
MKIGYTLMLGAGNRIAVVDERRLGREPPSASTIARLAEAGPLAGFDQLMWLLPSREPASAARYRVFNADGSEVEQCGNGVRCVALLLSTGDGAVVLDGPAGAVEARIAGDGRVAVNMGRPRFDPADLPFVADAAADTYEIDVDGHIVAAAAVSMGNPHCILEVADVATAAVESLGPAIEHHERFPKRTNVGFMKVRGADEIDLRVWERGVGETLACGTGACAAVVAARAKNLVGDDVRVNLPGGQLMVSWRGAAADPVWLTGETQRSSEGTVEI